MSRHALHVLAALAVGLVLLLFFVERTGRDAPEAVGTLLLPGLAERAEDIDEVVIESPGDAGDLSIRRRDGEWVVATRNDYPADFVALRRLVNALTQARIVEVATADPENHARVGLDEPSGTGGGTLVRLLGDDLDTTVVIGNAAQRDYRYVRLAADPQSYLVDADPGLPSDPGGWLESEIMDVGAERVRRVETVHASGETIVIEKTGDEADGFTVLDVPEGRELSYAGVGNGISRALESLSLEDVRADVDAPITTTTTFETSDNLTITARVAPLDDTDWIAFTAAADIDADTDDGPVTEADSINERVAGWWYELPAHKAGLFVRRWDDLLADVEDEDEDD